MLGKNHALVGATCWLGGVSILHSARPDLFQQIFPAISQGTGNDWAPMFLLGLSTVVASGAAVLPDLDEPEATAARSLGPAGRIASKTIRGAAGGHRQRTHTLLFAALMAALSYWIAGLWQASELWKSLPAAILVGVCTLWGFLLIGRAVEDRGISKIVSTPVAWLAGLSASGIMIVAAWVPPESAWGRWLFYVFTPQWWLPAALGVGVVAHLLGDLPTKSGVPVFWPLLKVRLAFKIMRVGGKGERIASFIVFIAMVIFGVIAVQTFWNIDASLVAVQPSSAAIEVNP